jgi:hypothetical protein
MINSSQEEFEKWVLDYFDGCCDLTKTRLNGVEGDYNDIVIHYMWCAWEESSKYIVFKI